MNLTHCTRYVAPLVLLIVSAALLYFFVGVVLSNPPIDNLWDLMCVWGAIFGIVLAILGIWVSLDAIRKGRRMS